MATGDFLGLLFGFKDIGNAWINYDEYDNEEANDDDDVGVKVGGDHWGEGFGPLPKLFWAQLFWPPRSLKAVMVTNQFSFKIRFVPMSCKNWVFCKKNSSFVRKHFFDKAFSEQKEIRLYVLTN